MEKKKLSINYMYHLQTNNKKLAPLAKSFWTNVKFANPYICIIKKFGNEN
jgi:hypothetical protein